MTPRELRGGSCGADGVVAGIVGGGVGGAGFTPVPPAAVPRVCWRPPRGFPVVGVGVGAGMGVRQLRALALASGLVSVLVRLLTVMMVAAASVK